MNSAFVQEQTRHLVGLAAFESKKSDRGRMEWLYRSILARNPSPKEGALASEFLADESSTWDALAQALLSSNEFAFVD